MVGRVTQYEDSGLNHPVLRGWEKGEKETTKFKAGHNFKGQFPLVASATSYFLRALISARKCGLCRFIH